jgi:paraquat-inducible protein B
MSDAKNGAPDLSEVPEAEVRTQKRRFSIVWLVPLVAVAIGGWLVYKAITEKGPTITITFKSAEGLEAGKTKVKYKDVELGQVASIELSDDLSHVVVTAEMAKQAEKFVSENTRFWVVRARVGATGVSGLGTLFSGAYLELDPGKPGKTAHKFKGLEKPPIVTADLPGSHYTLEAGTRGSIDIGAPVYYRSIQAGQVVAYQLDQDGQKVEFKIFIDHPYDKFVYTNTRFWNASGIDFKLDAEGIRVDTESLTSILVGGIVFEIPPNTVPAASAQKETVFELHKNYEAAMQESYATKALWLLYFDESVRGLAAGAPVEMYGIRIGEVIDVWLEYDRDQATFRAAVVIQIQPERATLIGQEEDSAEKARKRAEELVAKGLRGQLKTGSLLTGQKLIALDFFPDAKPATIDWEAKPHPSWPTAPTPMEEIGSKVTRIVDKIDGLPLEQIGKDLQAAVGNAKQLTASPEFLQAVRNLNATLKETQVLISDLRTRVAPEIGAVLEQAKQSLASAEEMLGTDSPVQIRMNAALEEIAGAARSLRMLTNYLERNPEALLRGKGKQK